MNHTFCTFIDSVMEDGKKEVPSVVLAVIGAVVTIILIAILMTLMAVMTCVVLTFYKRGRRESAEVELEKESDETKSDHNV